MWSQSLVCGADPCEHRVVAESHRLGTPTTNRSKPCYLLGDQDSLGTCHTDPCQHPQELPRGNNAENCGDMHGDGSPTGDGSFWL